MTYPVGSVPLRPFPTTFKICSVMLCHSTGNAPVRSSELLCRGLAVCSFGLGQLTPKPVSWHKQGRMYWH